MKLGPGIVWVQQGGAWLLAKIDALIVFREKAAFDEERNDGIAHIRRHTAYQAVLLQKIRDILDKTKFGEARCEVEVVP